MAEFWRVVEIAKIRRRERSRAGRWGAREANTMI